MASTNTPIPHVYVIWIAFLLFIGSFQPCLCFGGNSSRSGSFIERERKALLSIRKGIYGAETWLSWDGKDCCRWSGVRCHTMTGHVAELDLHYPLPFDVKDPFGKSRPKSDASPSLLRLRHLNYLDLSRNNFGGAPIPDFLGSLANLEYLNLSNAGFGGTIPHQLGNLSNLLYLDLTSGIHTIDASGIPYIFSAHLGGNTLGVDNLGWLAQIRFLQHLDMSFVNLSEASNWIHVINMLPSLSVLYLSGTSLPILPSTLPLVNFTSLTTLDLSWNNFATNIPSWMLNLSSLEHLDLGVNNFQGNIPLNIGNLKNLQVLNLSVNNFGGEIPKTIGRLTKLQILWLSANQISGEIPETVGNLHHLEELHLDGNSLAGVIPRTVGNLCNLRYFDASSNNIGGEITGFMEGLSGCSTKRLQSINLLNNNLSGPLPRQMGEFQSLEYLYLGFNSLNGSIPASMGKLSALSGLDLSSNSLTGALTEAHFANLKSLSFLDMSHNSLTVDVSQDWLPPFKAIGINMGSCPLGPKFPPWLRNQTNLYALDLSNTGISENFPDWFWDMGLPYLTLNASNNRMKGKLPISIKQKNIEEESHMVDFPSEWRFASFPYSEVKLLGYIGFIDLSNNLFSGPIPPALAGAIDHLQALLLAHNRFSGSIPSAFCEANYLQVLNLADNDLSGALPDCRNNSLIVIDFSDNKLSGGIPSSMGSLGRLNSLHLRNNNLSGTIPSSLQQCKQLITIDLGNNKLTGSIPEWIGNLSKLEVLRLRSNMLDGNIPMQLSLLASLQVLDLAGNRLSGTLPPSFGNFMAMTVTPNESEPIMFGALSYYIENVLITTKGQELTFTTVLSLVTSLDLSDNNISGEIPEEFTNLLGLYSLNLSGNHLTGSIPKNIGAMRQLESLDLSMNNLSGRIPTSISYLNFLENLNLSYNNLSGRIPSGNQLQTLNDSSYIGNQYLCGQPLPEKCPGDEPAGGPTAHGREEQWDENENDSEMIWFYVSLSPGFVVGFWGFLGAVLLKKSIRYAYIRFIDRICDWIYMSVTINAAKPRSKRNQRYK